MLLLSSYADSQLVYPPPKPELSIEKYMHKPMYMSGLYPKIRSILLRCPTSFLSYIKDI
jgi:hypothetical protein